MNDEYFIPRDEAESTIVIKNSRFIGKTTCTPTIEAAKDYIKGVKKDYPGCSHGVYAFCIGFGNSVTYGMSDAGEPPGTAGRPVLEVLKGRGIGDITLVVIRFFGGTKLGTGGLVKAYTQSAQKTLDALKIIKKIKTVCLIIRLGYEHYNAFEIAVTECKGRIIKKEFTTQVDCEVNLPEKLYEEFTRTLKDITSGKITIQQSNPTNTE